MESSDADLLAAWLERRDERAFRQLVHRYAGLVHVAARRTCADEHLAAEISQNVFVLLAKNAASLVPRGSLAGWLHLTAVMQARNVARGARREARKRARLHAQMDKPAGRDEHRWNEVRPQVDGALASLRQPDREVLLLHFYRSMSVAEVAAALGIAPDTARKRLERATGRLRERLMMRGLETGGSSMATLVIGAAGESQVSSATVSLLAAKAAAVTPAKAAFSGMPVLSSIVAMKGFVLMPPAAALLLAGAVLAYQEDDLMNLERQSGQLQARIQAADSWAAAAPRRSTTAARTGSMDWRAIAETLAGADNGIGGMKEIKERVRVENYLKSITAQEIVDAMTEIDRLDLRRETHEMMTHLLLEPLILKDPRTALQRFADDRLDGFSGHVMAYALGRWAGEDPAAAAAWLDGQIAAGRFEPRSLEGEDHFRDSFEGNLIRVLLGSDPVACARRLAALPAPRRETAFNEITQMPLEESTHAAYAGLAREALPAEIRAAALARPVAAIMDQCGYADVAAYLERIQATPAERAVSVEAAGLEGLRTIAEEREIGGGDLDAFADWATAQSPETADTAMAGALMEAGGVQPLPATGTFSVGGYVLIQEPASPSETAVKARTLALKISDPDRRARVLAQLE